MPNVSFFGTFVKGVTKESLPEKITSTFKISLLDAGRPDKFDEVLNKGFAADEVVVVLKEDLSVALFFNAEISTDWMEAIALTDKTEFGVSIVGQYDINKSSGFAKNFTRGNLSDHVSKSFNGITFPVYRTILPKTAGNETFENLIDDLAYNATGSGFFKPLYRSQNSDKRVIVFKFDNSPSALSELKTTYLNQEKIRKENNLKLFREYVNARSSTSAAFESNKYDKVIYQFLSPDYAFTTYSNFTINHIGSHFRFEKVLETFLNGSNTEIIQTIEEIAQDDINFYGLFDLALYTGLYHTDDKVRAHALGLTMISTHGGWRTDFWSIWKKDFYTKKIKLPSNEYGINFPHSEYALYYTNLLQYKYAEETKDAPKSIVMDALIGKFFPYYDELIVEERGEIINQPIYEFYDILLYFGKNLKSLGIINCNLVKLDEKIAQLSLVKLDLSNNPIGSIDSIKFGSLEELIIRNTPLYNISLKGLLSLKKIVLEDAAALDRMHLMDIDKLRPEFYFEVSTKDGPKKYFNFKKQEFDPFAVIPKKAFWKVW